MTKHTPSYDYERAVCGAAGAYMRVTGDTLAESIEECDCLACFRSVMRSDVGFRGESVDRFFERELRPRFVKLIRGMPGMRGDETFAEVLDIVADRLIPTEGSSGQTTLLGSIHVVSTPGWPEGAMTLVNTRDLDDLADQPVTLLGDVPLFTWVTLPNGRVAEVRSREAGLLVLVAYDRFVFDDEVTELLPAQTPCRRRRSAQAFNDKPVS